MNETCQLYVIHFPSFRRPSEERKEEKKKKEASMEPELTKIVEPKTGEPHNDDEPKKEDETIPKGLHTHPPSLLLLPLLLLAPATQEDLPVPPPRRKRKGTLRKQSSAEEVRGEKEEPRERGKRVRIEG